MINVVSWRRRCLLVLLWLEEALCRKQRQTATRSLGVRWGSVRWRGSCLLAALRMCSGYGWVWYLYQSVGISRNYFEGLNKQIYLLRNSSIVYCLLFFWVTISELRAWSGGGRFNVAEINHRNTFGGSSYILKHSFWYAVTHSAGWTTIQGFYCFIVAGGCSYVMPFRWTVCIYNTFITIYDRCRAS